MLILILTIILLYFDSLDGSVVTTKTKCSGSGSCSAAPSVFYVLWLHQKCTYYSGVAETLVNRDRKPGFGGSGSFGPNGVQFQSSGGGLELWLQLQSPRARTCTDERIFHVG